jgi:hypothetical protein
MTSGFDAVAQPKFIADARIRRFQSLIWVAYVLFPIFSQILAYDWLPNEYFDENRHEAIKTVDMCDGNGRCGDKHLVWKDKKTGEVFSVGDFVDHRHSEKIRMALADAVYALLGCCLFAYMNATKEDGSFHRNFGKAAIVASAIVAFQYFSAP